jgi:hypothetical protein
MHALEELRSENYDRGATDDYVRSLDLETQDMEARATEREGYFQATGRALDRASDRVQRAQTAQRPSRTERERAGNAYAAAWESHSLATTQWLQSGLAYERRMQGILDSAGVPRLSGGSQNQNWAMNTLPDQSNGQSQSAQNQAGFGSGHSHQRSASRGR